MYVYIDIHVYHVAHLLKSHSPKSPKMMVFLRMVWDSSPKCPWNAWPQQVQPSGSLRPEAATTAGHRASIAKRRRSKSSGPSRERANQWLWPATALAARAGGNHVHYIYVYTIYLYVSQYFDYI